jgi:Transposase DDE domain
MAPFIESALDQVKGDLAEALSAEKIEQICRELNYSWRACTLDPATTVHAFLRQVLAGNTACDHVPHLTGLPITGEAYCKARSRLPVELFQRLMREVAEVAMQTGEAAARWCGHRLWNMDGSSCSMPDTPELQQAFGQSGMQKPGCGFPVAHLLTLFHASTGFLLRMVTAPLRTHDMAQAQRVHNTLEANDVVIGDRGFCSYAHLAMLQLAGVFGLFRIHQRTIVSFRKRRAHVPPGSRGKKGRRAKGQPSSRWVKSLGRHDQIVEYFKPRQRPKWMTSQEYARLPESVLVRELRYRVTQRGFRVREVTLATTLLDAERYPAAELTKLYFKRWEVETDLRHLKQTLHMDVLRTKTVDGIHKELAMFAIVYNLVRLVILRAAKRQNVAVDRISFIDAQRWLCHAPIDAPCRALNVLPDRPNRFEPRVRKRRPKEYDLMNKTRQQLKQALIRKQLTS